MTGLKREVALASGLAVVAVLLAWAMDGWTGAVHVFVGALLGAWGCALFIAWGE